MSNNYLENGGTQVYPVNKESVKIDHIFNDKHRINGYYGHDREHQTAGPDGPPTLPGLYSNYNDLVQISDVIRFSWGLVARAQQAEPLLCRGQRLETGSQAAAGIYRQLAE
ncbi:MAG: hypothetical protein WDO73_13805 [Ignavibacteriota bacterium]